MERWEDIARAVNDKGAAEAAGTSDTYITKKNKACQEKFYHLMDLCQKEEFKHLRLSGRHRSRATLNHWRTSVTIRWTRLKRIV